MTVHDWWDSDHDAVMQWNHSAIQGLALHSGTFYGEIRAEAQSCRRYKSTVPTSGPAMKSQTSSAAVSTSPSPTGEKHLISSASPTRSTDTALN
jgi:hypothetical protein